MKLINKLIIGLCAAAALLVIAAVVLGFLKGAYPFSAAKWYNTPQQVLDSLGLTLADVKINSGSSNSLAKDEKSLISYEASEFVWEGIKGDLFLTFSEKGLIWVEFRAPLQSLETANQILTKKHGKPSVDTVGNSLWGKQMGSGNGITLFSNSELIYLNFYAG